MNKTNLLFFLTVFLFSPCFSLPNGVGILPPMGWTTWCTENNIIPCLNDFCNEQEIRSVADSMISNGLVSLGYNHILLDDCWAGPRLENHTITADQTRFPSGIPALADYLHSRGLKLGLYTDAGTQTCKYGRPGSWPYYRLDASTYASWGVDWVKMDWCNHPGGYTAPELYGMMRDALNQTGRKIFFAICEWGLFDPWIWGNRTGNSWRVGPDHLPLWWTPETNQDPGQGQGTSNIIEHMAGLSGYAGPGGWNDPDFLMTGIWEGGMGETDWQTEFSFWSLFAAPLIVASDVRDLSNKQVLLNKEVISVNQDPLGIAGDRRSNNLDGSQVWTKPLSNGSYAAIFYNQNFLVPVLDVKLEFNENFLPGWPAGFNVAEVRDLWKHKDLGIFKDFIKMDILEGHAVVMVKITPLKSV
eukprot:TRINITY_DN15748_c0_g1_i1.p1 TRINITY_DN15748_c0_g1~~TRINITY_DN15748_c0_g1_i1.p1  ORF type:complete len:414 (-),score=38.31 TRINITY_DN15748_c0_g1_i1:152-1393(-)